MALVMMGCGAAEDTLPREPIWGRVTLDGSPLKAGMISFDPDGPVQGTAVAASAGAVITDGQYSIERAKGLTPGKYRAAILSEGGAAPTDEASGPITSRPPSKDPIPARYNSASTLRVEVVRGGPKPFDFDLKSR
jgi:hypothetical protein